MKYKRKFTGKVGQSFILFAGFWGIMHFLGWYSEGFEEFLNLELVCTTMCVSILLALLLSNSGKTKNEIYELLPFVNSYIVKEDEISHSKHYKSFS